MTFWEKMIFEKLKDYHGALKRRAVNCIKHLDVEEVNEEFELTNEVIYRIETILKLWQKLAEPTKISEAMKEIEGMTIQEALNYIKKTTKEVEEQLQEELKNGEKRTKH